MLTLGLLNTYDKIKILDAHYRSIARAAPICYAYGFSLVLYDYPYKMSCSELVEFISKKTTIGNSGKYLKLLYQEQHFFIFNLKDHGIPSLFGKLIATTSHPDIKKKINHMSIINGFLNNKSYIFLVGLGRKGLPKEIINQAIYHLDITNKGISLETCTAIGSIPTMIYYLMKKYNKEK